MPGASAADGGLAAPGWAGGGRHGKLVGLGLGLGSAAVLALAGPPGVWETGALLGRAVGAVLGGGSSGGEPPSAGHGPSSAAGGAWSQKRTLATQLRERLAGVLEDLTASERHRRALMAPPLPAAAARPADAAASGGASVPADATGPRVVRWLLAVDAAEGAASTSPALKARARRALANLLRDGAVAPQVLAVPGAVPRLLALAGRRSDAADDPAADVAGALAAAGAAVDALPAPDPADARRILDTLSDREEVSARPRRPRPAAGGGRTPWPGGPRRHTADRPTAELTISTRRIRQAAWALRCWAKGSAEGHATLVGLNAVHLLRGVLEVRERRAGSHETAADGTPRLPPRRRPGRRTRGARRAGW